MLLYFTEALQGIFIVVFITLLGAVLCRKGWFDEKSEAMIARLVTNVALPLSLFVGLRESMTREKLAELLPDTCLPVFHILLAMAAGALAVHFFQVRKGRKGIFFTNFFVSNTMFIGLPVNLALFGEKSLPPLMVYYVISVLFFWTAGLQAIIADCAGERPPVFSLQTLKNIFSVPFQGVLVGLLFVFMDWHVPKFLLDSCRYVGNMTIPLSLIFIGIEVGKMSVREFKIDRDMMLSIIGRYLICPGTVLLLAAFIPAAPLSLKVFTMQAAMPSVTILAILAKNYGGDSQYAASLNFVTILLGILVLPVYMAIVSTYF